MTKIHLKLGQQNYFFGIGMLEQELAKMGYVVETGLLDIFYNDFTENAPVCIIVDSLLIRSLTERNVSDSGYPRLIVPIVSAIDWANELSAVEELKKLGYIIVDLFCDERMHKAEFLPALAFEINAAVKATEKFVFGYVPTGKHPGAFGVRRRHHYHTGVDLYVHRDNAIVYPFADGEVVDYGHFTGTFCNSPWWNNTHYIAVKHDEHVVVYGEILLSNDFIGRQGGIVNNKHIGKKVTRQTPLGVIVPVTKNRHTEYLYHNNKMLHVELYDASKFRAARVDEWELDKKQPGALLDPTEFLLSMSAQVVPNIGFEEVITWKGVRLSIKKFTKADVDELVALSAGLFNYEIDRFKKLIVTKGLGAYNVGKMIDEMEYRDFEEILDLIVKVNAEVFPLGSDGCVSLAAFLQEEMENCII